MRRHNCVHRAYDIESYNPECDSNAPLHEHSSSSPFWSQNHDTALMLAAWGGHARIAVLLLRHGANVNIQDKVYAWHGVWAINRSPPRSGRPSPNAKLNIERSPYPASHSASWQRWCWRRDTTTQTLCERYYTSGLTPAFNTRWGGEIKRVRKQATECGAMSLGSVCCGMCTFMCMIM